MFLQYCTFSVPDIWAWLLASLTHVASIPKWRVCPNTPCQYSEYIGIAVVVFFTQTRLALPVYSCPSMMIDTKKIFGLLLPWVIVLTGRIFSLAFRASDSTGVILIGFVTKMIIECLEWCTYHFRQVDNWYVAEVRHIAERTSNFEGE